MTEYLRSFFAVPLARRKEALEWCIESLPRDSWEHWTPNSTHAVFSFLDVEAAHLVEFKLRFD